MGIFRILLAICVLIFHTGNTNIFNLHFMDGRVAVFCFFVISGFYMEMILAQKYTEEKLGKSYLLRFYMSRFWRLYPAYILIACITLGLGLFSPLIELPQAFSLHSQVSHKAITWFSSATMLFLNIPSTKELLVPPGWTLGVEISFYVLAPFILRMRLPWLLFIAACGLSFQFIPYAQHSPLLFGIPFFLLGSLTRRNRQSIIALLSKVTNVPLIILYGVLLAIVMFAIPYDIYLGHYNKHTYNNLDIFLYPVITAFLIPILHERTKSNRLDYWIGQLSYPFYISHQIIIDIFKNWHINYRLPILIVVTLCISAILTVLELRLIEPWRKKFAS